MRRDLNRGFTLIEAVIVIVLLGVAMVTFSTLLSPQLTQSSAPHYYTRTSALSQSVMTDLLSRDYDSITQSSAISVDSSYVNFNIDLSVSDASPSGDPNSLKMITLDISASNQPTVSVTAFKGNY